MQFGLFIGFQAETNSLRMRKPMAHRFRLTWVKPLAAMVSLTRIALAN
jgi:hypothetical protein